MMFDTEIDKTGYIGFPPYEQEDAEAPYVVDMCLPEKKDLEKFVELIDGMDSLLEPGKDLSNLTGIQNWNLVPVLAGVTTYG